MFWLAVFSGQFAPKKPLMMFAANADRSVRRVLVHDFALTMNERRHGKKEEDVVFMYTHYYNDY